MLIELLINYIKRTRYIVVFVRKEYDSFCIVSQKELKDCNKAIKITENKSIIVGLENPTYINKTIRYYLFNIETGSQLLFNNSKNALTPEEIDLFMSQNLVKELANGVIDNKKEKMFTLISGIIVGALIASLIMVLIYTQKINDIYSELAKNSVNFVEI